MRVGSRLWTAVGLSAALGVAGCANEPPDKTAAQDRADAKAVAQVMAQQTPPAIELELQPIQYDDIVDNPAMEGPGCSFYPADSEDPFAILAEEVGFVKFEGSVKRFAPDAGSEEGSLGTRAKYDGRKYSLRIAIDESAREEGEGVWAAPASLGMADGWDRRVTGSEGRIACAG